MTSHIHIDKNRPVRVRIAPSPTGDPHVGTAYVALFNKAFAQKHDGKFILRIEDTDQQRSTRSSEAAIFSSLRWLGLDWHEGPDVGGDFGPYRQSERTEIYQKYVAQLIDSGHAYPCFATAEELDEMRAEQKEKGLRLGYDRRYRDLSKQEAQKRIDAGESYVVRLKMPLMGQTAFIDGLRGEISINNDQLDDQVLLKSDGFPTYHLANVVDDHLMGISHVIRAEEWIPSTPKHVLLYQAFGWQPPGFIHLPLLRNSDKSKISKRKNPVSLDYYHDIGILPEAMVNFLGRMGWSMPDESEKFSYQEMVDHFDMSRISLSGPIFDLEKLSWLNGLYLRELDENALVDRLYGWLFSRDYLTKTLELFKDRLTTFEDLVTQANYVLGKASPCVIDDLIRKGGDKAEAYRVYKSMVTALDEVREWQTANIEEVMKAQLQESGWKPRDLFMSVRFAISGTKATPSVYETMELIGKQRVQARLRAAMELLKP